MPIFTGEAWGWGYDRYVWFNTAIRPDRIRHVIALPVEVVGCRILVRWMFPKIGFHMANTCAMVQGYNTVSKDLLRIEIVEIRNRLSHWRFAVRGCSKWNSSVMGGMFQHYFESAFCFIGKLHRDRWWWWKLLPLGKIQLNHHPAPCGLPCQASVAETFLSAGLHNLDPFI